MIHENNLIESLASAFGLDVEEINAFVDYYNNNFDKYDNNIYQKIESRIVHWVNYDQKDWFQERIELFINYIEKVGDKEPLVVVDLGFSVPYVYTRERVLSNKKTSFVFCDKYISSQFFYNRIIQENGLESRAERDSLHIVDLDRKDECDKLARNIANIDNVENSTIVVFASEVIEHLENPEVCWNFIKQLKMVGRDVVSYITLPIGEKIPSHNLEFSSGESARKYLEKNRSTVLDEVILHPDKGSEVSPFLMASYCALVAFDKNDRKAMDKLV